MSAAIVSPSPVPGGAPAPRRWALTVLWLNVAGSTILVATELFALAASFDWALSGLLGLPPVLAIGLGGVLAAASIAVIWVFARRAFLSEKSLALQAEPLGG